MKLNINKLILESLNKSEYHIKHLSDSDLYDIAKKGLTSDYSSSGCWDDTDDIEEAIECVTSDFKNYLYNHEYPKGFKNIPDTITIYRALHLKDVNDFNYDNVGFSFYATPNHHQSSGFTDMLEHLKGRDVYILHCEINISNIDVYTTLWQRTTQYQENEITLLRDDKNSVKFIKLEKIR